MTSSLSVESQAVIRGVLAGKIDRDKIHTLPGRRLRVQAAVALMLANRQQYLDDDNRVKGGFGQHLRDITGESKALPHTLTSTSREAKLHRALRKKPGASGRGSWEVYLTPPPELLSLVDKPTAQPPAVLTQPEDQKPGQDEKRQWLPAEDPQHRAYVIVQALLVEGSDVLHDVHRRLRAICDPNY